MLGVRWDNGKGTNRGGGVEYVYNTVYGLAGMNFTRKIAQLNEKELKSTSLKTSPSYREDSLGSRAAYGITNLAWIVLYINYID